MRPDPLPIESRISDPIFLFMNERKEADMENYIPAASVEAYRQLVALNLQLNKPEVADWLHSDEAEPVLQQLLLNVPCAGTLH
jgi:hypothetical protein